MSPCGGSTSLSETRRGRPRGAVAHANRRRMPPKPLRRDVPMFQRNYTKAASTFAISMTSICYADRLARRNAVAKFSCNPGDLTDHPSLRARSKFAPHHPPSEVPAPVGPRRLARARTKQHTVCAKVALNCANVGTRAPSLALLAQCQRSHEPSHAPREPISVAQMAICETQSQRP
jgi:hypothetical protein